MRDEIQSIRMLLGFFAGFVAVLLFQQPVLALLHGLRITPQAPYSNVTTLPLGVPYVWARAFWGGVFGVILAGIDNRFPAGAGLWKWAAIFGALAPTALEWILTLALRHQPLGGIWTIGTIVSPLLINAAWGVGAEAILSVISVRWRVDLDVMDRP